MKTEAALKGTTMLARILIAPTCALALAGSAAAADLPLGPPPPAAPIFTWGGFYLGGQIGYAWGADNSQLTVLSGPLGGGFLPPAYVSSAVSPAGAIGGVHIGHNWQVNQWVLGLEGEVDGTSLNKGIQPTSYLLSNTRSPVQGNIRGRIGIAFDHILVYATGGGAYAAILNAYNVLGAQGNFRTTRSGWTVGGGVEYAVDNHWSVRAEYRYSDFGYFYDGPAVFPQVFESHHWTENQVKAGFSYKFGASAPAVIAAKN
jgi:outer membrane immunogenic protein